MITDPGANILDVNEAFTLITGYGHDEAVGKNSRLLQSGRHDPEFYQTMWQELTEQGHWQAKIWNRRKNREIYAQYLSINAVNDDKGQVHHYVGIFSDITHQIEHEQQMEHLAHFDALTDLPNRVLLADRLQQAMTQTERRGKQLAIIFLDLDGFKEINDNFGHKAGDHLLTSISSRLLEALREGDTVARLGGDEFAAVLIDMENDTNCVPLLERLLETASHPVHFGDQILQVSASIGVTFYPQADSIDPDQLLRQADQAMYQAKLAGKNCYQLFDAEMDRSVRGHHGSVEHIRQALDTGEFILYYQPKVNMRTGEVVGAEALIRWQHPEKGLLSPEQFLPVIENDPTSLLLDAWVINEAVSQLGHWHRQGAELSVSVNISSHNIQQPDFFSRFKAQLDAHPNLDSRFLELEVLETSALEDLSHASDVIKACAEIGIHFALDDFGTGYSSLTYLKQLPASVLKVDRSFVRDMLDDPEDLAILEGIIGLASAFRRQVVAEGVETLEHGKLLLQLGCELAQGYGIANPMPGEDLPDWITEWRPHPQWTKQYPVSRDDHAVLFAISEHRAWIRNFAAFLNDESDELPPVDISDCQFSKWIKGSGRLRYDSHPAFNAILKIHQQVHSIAAELYQLYRQEQRQEAIDGLNALYEIRDALLMQMELLLEDSQIRDSK